VLVILAVVAIATVAEMHDTWALTNTPTRCPQCLNLFIRTKREVLVAKKRGDFYTRTYCDICLDAWEDEKTAREKQERADLARHMNHIAEHKEQRRDRRMLEIETMMHDATRELEELQRQRDAREQERTKKEVTT